MNLGIAAYARVARMSGEATAPLARSSATRGGNVPISGVSEKQRAEMLKLKRAATQFEAMLLEKWWSSMKESGLSEDDSSDPRQGTLDNMGMQAMSTAIASAGGIGIASMLVRSLQGQIATGSANAKPPLASAAGETIASSK